MLCLITPSPLWCSSPSSDSSLHTMWILSLKKLNLMVKLLLLPWLSKYIILYRDTLMFVFLKLNLPEPEKPLLKPYWIMLMLKKRLTGGP